MAGAATTDLREGGVAAFPVEEGQVQGGKHRGGEDEQDDDPVPHVLGAAPRVDAAWAQEAKSTTRLEPPLGAAPSAAALRDTPGLRWRLGCSAGEAASASCLPVGDASACREPLPRQPLSRWRSASSCETLASTKMPLRSCMPALQRRSRSGAAWKAARCQAALANGGHWRHTQSAVCHSRSRSTPARPGEGGEMRRATLAIALACPSPSAPSRRTPAVAAPSPVQLQRAPA